MKLFPIFHPGRCASTFLEKVLAQLGFLHFGEITMPGNPWIDMLPNGQWQTFSSVSDFIYYIHCHATLAIRHDSSLRARSSDTAFLEIKLNNYGISPFGDLERIASIPSVQGCIFLYSKNYLRRLTSAYRAVQHGQWHTEKSNTNYNPGLIFVDWNSIDDPDVFRIIGKSLHDAVKLYHKVMFTQSEIIRQVCASRNLPFLSLSFEDLTDTSQLSGRLDHLFRDLRMDSSRYPSFEEIEESINAVSLTKTGPKDIEAGLSPECLNAFHQIEDYKAFLPGGAMDISIESWY
jgi:hypothetical protein